MTHSKIADWIISKFSRWLLKTDPPTRSYLCDFNRICEEIRPADVLLVEGRTRVSRIISHISLSPWTHAALYIGQIDEIEDPQLQEIISQYAQGHSYQTQWLIETEFGLGTTLAPIEKYRQDHVRILRPIGLTHDDGQKVIGYTIKRLGKDYSIRHVLDLARFIFPWGIFPRQWRSSLFNHNAQKPTEDICSTLIAAAFESINFPILPLIKENSQGELQLIKRNSNLYTPSDFDYSPYFSVIKYPIFPVSQNNSYHNLPWDPEAVSDDIGIYYLSENSTEESVEIKKEEKKPDSVNKT